MIAFMTAFMIASTFCRFQLEISNSKLKWNNLNSWKLYSIEENLLKTLNFNSNGCL